MHINIYPAHLCTLDADVYVDDLSFLQCHLFFDSIVFHAPSSICRSFRIEKVIIFKNLFLVIHAEAFCTEKKYASLSGFPKTMHDSMDQYLRGRQLIGVSP